jgi:hypothetical protein
MLPAFQAVTAVILMGAGAALVKVAGLAPATLKFANASDVLDRHYFSSLTGRSRRDILSLTLKLPLIGPLFKRSFSFS